MTISKKLLSSLSEMKNIYSLAAIAMLLALRIVLGFFANATLPIFGNSIKLGASFLPIAVAGAMFGPFPAAIIGALGDILSFIISPTGAYYPGFTISGFITGLIYGIAFYKSEINLFRVAAAWFVNMLTVETFLAAYWLTDLYGKSPYIVYLGIRFLSESIKLIPEIVLIMVMCKLSTKVKLSASIHKHSHM